MSTSTASAASASRTAAGSIQGLVVRRPAGSQIDLPRQFLFLARQFEPVAGDGCFLARLGHQPGSSVASSVRTAPTALDLSASAGSCAVAGQERSLGQRLLGHRFAVDQPARRSGHQRRIVLDASRPSVKRAW